ncbi:MAG: AraC family transcriptional regulator [Lachnospiraceae bacterium]|nr:AraC family transcriptional regulator [Lachnospiraceae bacterium]
MSDSICKFMPAKSDNDNIKTINFVYESDFKSLRQPFFRAIYALHLVTKGTGTLKINSSVYPLKKGTAYFAFPGTLYEIEASNDFEYIYISFMGSYVVSLFEKLDITLSHPVYPDFGHMINFWKNSIKRVNQANANILTECALLYALSFINNSEEPGPEKKKDDLLGILVDYIDNHYKDADMSLNKIAANFSYTEKYLSHFFKKNMNIGFNSYLTNLRIQYACELIERDMTSVSQIASLCGYCDPLYFSRVFKKIMGVTPSDQIKKIHSDIEESTP